MDDKSYQVDKICKHEGRQQQINFLEMDYLFCNRIITSSIASRDWI